LNKEFFRQQFSWPARQSNFSGATNFYSASNFSGATDFYSASNVSGASSLIGRQLVFVIKLMLPTIAIQFVELSTDWVAWPILARVCLQTTRRQCPHYPVRTLTGLRGQFSREFVCKQPGVSVLTIHTDCCVVLLQLWGFQFSSESLFHRGSDILWFWRHIFSASRPMNYP
jgi:hypothetical protein